MLVKACRRLSYERSVSGGSHNLCHCLSFRARFTFRWECDLQIASSRHSATGLGRPVSPCRLVSQGIPRRGGPFPARVGTCRGLSYERNVSGRPHLRAPRPLTLHSHLASPNRGRSRAVEATVTFQRRRRPMLTTTRHHRLAREIDLAVVVLFNRAVATRVALALAAPPMELWRDAAPEG